MTKISKRINLPINRAEGDLEIQVEVKNDTIVDAWSAGTMYRGFEAMMIGRGARDGLVVTPRVCGICSLTHLTAAVEALDEITGIAPPDNARRLRNLALMVESIQSDIRQAVLMFMADFANHDAYQHHPLGDDARRRYNPLEGESAIQVIRETKRLLQIVAIIGGQWPHTSFMVPGGVTSIPEIAKIQQCKLIFERFCQWYERSILGCSVERWNRIKSINDLEAWLDESSSHRESEVGFFMCFSRQVGLDALGKGPCRFLSYGNYTLPDETTVKGVGGRLFRAGFSTGVEVEPFDSSIITEDTSHAWFEKTDKALHPFAGETKPYASGHSGRQYSWIKAPRYGGQTVETGPLAEMIINGHPLFQEMVKDKGPSVFARELARLVRPVSLLGAMRIWLEELLEKRNETFYFPVGTIPDGEGAGLIQAARGALGHWVKVKNNKIAHYQIITPTAWNGSPRDSFGVRGAWEEALVGTTIKDIHNPVEAGHVVRSFDPCLVCAVHCIQKGRKKGFLTVGV